MSAGESVFETVFGVPYENDEHVMYRRLFECITGEPWTLEMATTEELRIRNFILRSQANEQPIMTLTDVERALSHQILAQVMHDDRQSCSNFFDWPLYQGVFRNRGRPISGGNALMLGANESLSSLAFTALATEVYGAEKAYVVDIAAGKDKQKHGNFIFGDALRLPFRDGSMSIVHSSQLLHKIIDTLNEYTTPETQMQQVINEAGRALKPGGQLLMREVIMRHSEPCAGDKVTINSDYQKLYPSVVQICKSAGFEEVCFAPIIVPKTLKGLLDPCRNFWSEGYEMRPGVYMIYARMPDNIIA